MPKIYGIILAPTRIPWNYHQPSCVLLFQFSFCLHQAQLYTVNSFNLVSPVSPIFLIIFVPPLTIPLKIALSHGQFIT